MLEIRIYDDESPLAEQYAEGLRNIGDLHVERLEDSVFASEIENLMERRRHWRSDGCLGDSTSIFDGLDVLVIDFDLLEATAAGELIVASGEDVAYLVRCFSSCRFVLGMNLPLYRENGFDLTLRGHLESYADLNIASDQLANTGLWSQAFQKYRPWHWPVIPEYLREYERRLEDARDLDAPIHRIIGLPQERMARLPRTTGEFLGGAPEEATLRGFVRESGNGLLPKDAPEADCDEEVLARIAAARLAKWIERRLLPGQDILVDAPHLVSRFPSLLRGSPDTIEDWNATARLDAKGANSVTEELVSGSRLERPHWVSRPTWLWDQVRECEQIAEVREPWSVELPNWSFCEDTSRFCADARQFRADLESPYSLRYVRRLEKVRYRPVSRLLG
jgi:hypothetical protein